MLARDPTPLEIFGFAHQSYGDVGVLTPGSSSTAAICKDQIIPFTCNHFPRIAIFSRYREIRERNSGSRRELGTLPSNRKGPAVHIHFVIRCHAHVNTLKYDTTIYEHGRPSFGRQNDSMSSLQKSHFRARSRQLRVRKW